jgi:hypothetical protein
MDFLEHAAVDDVVVLSVVLEEARHKNQSAYQRLRALCASGSRRFFVFANEHHRCAARAEHPTMALPSPCHRCHSMQLTSTASIGTVLIGTVLIGMVLIRTVCWKPQCHGPPAAMASPCYSITASQLSRTLRHRRPRQGTLWLQTSHDSEGSRRTRRMHGAKR